MSGTSMTPLLRFLPAEYDDGLSSPKQAGLPNPREISKYLRETEHEQTSDEDSTIMLMQWGQFTDHDLSLTLPAPRKFVRNTDPILACEDTCEHIEPCFGLKDDANKTRFYNNHDRLARPRADCMEVVRSAEVCGTGRSSILFEKKLVQREQINELSAFIDAGNLYGADAARGKYIREHNRRQDRQGKLRTGDNGFALDSKMNYTNANMTKVLLSFDVSFRTAMGGALSVLPMDCRRDTFYEEKHVQDTGCFLAGDRRANIHLGLTILHTIYTRLHNDFVDRIQKIKPNMNGNVLYQEVRRIVTFHMQMVTYNRWLPIVLGQEYPKYQGYDESIHVGVFNEFATAAFRFGHTLIPHSFPRKGVNYTSLDPWPLHKLLFSPYRLITAGGVDPILRGIISSPTRDNKNGKISTELTENFFKINGDVPIDLAALNIQRGRDHGIGGYGKYLKFCGLESTLPDDILELYDGDVNKVDLWVGVISEPNVEGGKIGPLGKSGILRLRNRNIVKTIFRPKCCRIHEINIAKSIFRSKVNEKHDF